MANEILYSGIGDLRVPAVLGQELQMLLADRGALGQHPAIQYLGDLGGSGSSTLKVPLVGWNGYDDAAAYAEAASIANTALTDASVTVAVARQGKTYEGSALAKGTDPFGLINDAAAFAQDAAMTHALRLTGLIANITDDFTATAGASGVNMTLANFMDAQAILDIAEVDTAEGQTMALLATRQLQDLRSNIATAAGGAVQYNGDLQAQLPLLGGAYRGRLLGTDIFVSNRVPTANAAADRAGGMWGKGGVGWADMTVTPDVLNSANRIHLGKIILEGDSSARTALNALVMYWYQGVVTMQDAAGVSIITDA